MLSDKEEGLGLSLGFRLTTMDGNMADGIPSSSHSMADGMRPESLVGSPASSSGGASRQRQKQVPISRSTASGYERPERARTSHACEPCRERKTKCDGERPSCRRCLHTGTTCHYGYGKGWKKRKTAEDLNVTSSKLARYERLLNDIFPLVSNDVRNMIDDVRQQEFASASASSLDQVDSQDSLASPFELDRRRTSPTMNRLPPPPSVQMSQSTPSFMSTPRPLVPPLPNDPSQSPLPSTASVQRSSKSPPDDMSISSAIRLPSITRHGFLVEDGSRGQMAHGPGPSSPVLDGQLSNVSSTDADQPTAGTSFATTPHT